MTPENGGRIELKLAMSSGDAAEYEAHLQTASRGWRALVQVGAGAPGKQVVFGAWSPTEPGEPTGAAPPDWLTEDARAALKAALRTSQTEGRWPRRITRWRPEPSG
jgi:hypothetical protein